MKDKERVMQKKRISKGGIDKERERERKREIVRKKQNRSLLPGIPRQQKTF